MPYLYELKEGQKFTWAPQHGRDIDTDSVWEVLECRSDRMLIETPGMRLWVTGVLAEEVIVQ